ncbi:uncharacterized protein LOC113278890 [Papaver somniferum]|uniref:uncharacterized protein LOC113278890 n=1 Tax=Papaver somniferum TaxID=3469 RepID=UPI000E70512B|nr:uncharacterized protein LOC113278890 [Papaver somniferum]
MEAHLKHLQLTLAMLRKHSLFAKLSKCAFAQPQLEYLGHIITANGVAADPDKVTAMVSWPQPQTLKQLRGFLGLTATTDSFAWSDAATHAFSSIKLAMTSAPVLALPDFSQPFTLETDACSKGVGVVLMQNGKPIAFLNKPLGPKALALSTYEKEFLAIILSIQKWKHYLCSQQFIIHTDHQILKYLMDQKLSTSLQQKWLVKLMGLDYVIKYKKGSENQAADALSRLPSASCSSLSSILRFKGRLYIGSGTALRSSILHSLHASAVGGRSGINGTYHRARTSFFWPNMKTDIIKLVTSCDVCQCNKGDNSFPGGLLQPLPIPDTSWQHISLDFIEGLPMSFKKNVILVVVDRLTKYSHFIPLGHPFTAITVSKEFLSHVFKLHGLPSSIERDLMLQQLKEDLSKAQSRMNFFADKKRTDKHFEVGDLVFLKLQPYRQTSVVVRKNFKLSAKYFGPFEVIQKVGVVAYKLKLPVGSRIHPVFHVSQLKKKIGLQTVPSPQLPLVDHAGQFVIEPVAVLDTRTTVRGTFQIPQVLVKWCNSDPSDSTWEYTAHIQAQFPDFILEYKDL